MSCNTMNIREITDDGWTLLVKPVKSGHSLINVAMYGTNGLQFSVEQTRHVARAMLACADEIEAEQQEEDDDRV